MGLITKVLIFTSLLFGTIYWYFYPSDRFENMATQIVEETDAPALSYEDFLRKYQKNKDLKIIDVREPEEFRISHIRNAVNINYSTFSPTKVVGKYSKQDTIIIYCSVGYRSGIITQKLQEEGFTNVVNLYGGIFYWINQGNLIYDSNGKVTQKIHGYDKDWSRWLKYGDVVY